MLIFEIPTVWAISGSTSPYLRVDTSPTMMSYMCEPFVVTHLLVGGIQHFLAALVLQPKAGPAACVRSSQSGRVRAVPTYITAGTPRVFVACDVTNRHHRQLSALGKADAKSLVILLADHA
uniref:hypothetical protein n=1 Tax=Burkholderia arboris TaxID=488730 RepID=UPI003BEF1A1E